MNNSHILNNAEQFHQQDATFDADLAEVQSRFDALQMSITQGLEQGEQVLTALEEDVISFGAEQGAAIEASAIELIKLVTEGDAMARA